MRDFKGMKRQRGRNRKPGGGGNQNSANPNRSWDSQGPENIKVRGNAQTVYERYQALARDAASAGDRVLAENYGQHAEHYFRVLRALQPQRSFQEIAARENLSQGFDIDFEDESGAQAAAFLAAQQAADRAAQQGGQPQGQGQGSGQGSGQGGDFARNDGEGDTREPREAREPREPRDRDRDDRSDGEGGRRETRRERWERRREERDNRPRSERPMVDGDAPADAGVEASEGDAPVAEAREERPADRPRRGRAPREAREVGDDGGADTALPGFLTRSSAPAAPAAQAEDEPAPARRPRAPRRKAVEDAPTED